MKNLNCLNEYRVPLYGSMGDETCGAFIIKIKGEEYFIIADANPKFGWEHVSISQTKNKKIPSWNTMCTVKDLFFEEDEVVMQLHPSKKDYINISEKCLHLWKPIDKEIPLPPKKLV